MYSTFFAFNFGRVSEQYRILYRDADGMHYNDSKRDTVVKNHVTAGRKTPNSQSTLLGFRELYIQIIFDIDSRCIRMRQFLLNWTTRFKHDALQWSEKTNAHKENGWISCCYFLSLWPNYLFQSVTIFHISLFYQLLVNQMSNFCKLNLKWSTNTT